MAAVKAPVLAAKVLEAEHKAKVLVSVEAWCWVSRNRPRLRLPMEPVVESERQDRLSTAQLFQLRTHRLATWAAASPVLRPGKRDT